MKNTGSLKRLFILALAASSLHFSAHSAFADTEQGQIRMDGSSTVFPISEAVAEEFSKVDAKIRVNVGVSGTGGGFKKFVMKETDISNASRPIKKEEAEAAKKNGVEYIEIPVAYDGITIVVNPKNTWATSLTTDELKAIWAPDSKIKTWKDVRPAWPAKDIKLFGPGTDSGTFDYFAEVIEGKVPPLKPGEAKKAPIRSDYVKSEDDNILVRAVAGEANAMGFFGYAYFVENKEKLKALGVNDVLPNVETIRTGSYKPLSRPVFIYVNKASLKKAHVKKFVEFYIKNAGALSAEVGYVPLPDDQYQKALKSL